MDYQSPGGAALDNCHTAVGIVVEDNSQYMVVVVVADSFPQTVVAVNFFLHIAVEDNHIVVAVGDNLH